MNLPVILMVSGHPETRHLLETVLPAEFTILTASSVSDTLRLWKERDPALVLCQGTPKTVLSLLDHARQGRRTPVIALSEDPSVKAAVELMRAGASDVLAAPPAPDDLESAIRRVIGTPAVAVPPADIGDRFDHIVSVSPQVALLKQLAREVAATDATVLITGESGTGKELFAQGIHAASPRTRGPLVALNCAGIPEHLLEAELFGYQQGAFTDAKQAKPGRFQIAEGGTLFLDEIGEMSLAAQAKLLRVLETHSVDPLGDTRTHKVNIRVIAATNEDLLAQIKAGRFRLDLYYRLNVYQLRIPPLRERPEDIGPIFDNFLELARHDHGCRIKGLAPETLGILRRHEWPGNVRELHNLAEWLSITCKDELIQPQHLPPSITATPVEDRPAEQHGTEVKPSLLAFGLSFQEMEKKLLEEALREASGNISEASRLLKITRNTLRYRMAKYHIS
jgi:two-component system NtrC family response regulator/two-component system response regulator HydG